MNVPAHTPIQEAIGRMLFGVENVPPDVARRMVSQTARMASEYVSNIEAERDRLRDELRRYLPVIERCEGLPALWAWCTKGTGIATANGYRAALQEAGDE